MDDRLKLSSGRNLAYAEFGDPGGTPVFFFHGMPGSRFFRPPDEITRQMGVRLITVDRPGYGRSDFQPGRRILDWPDDIAQLADFLGLDAFAVAGHSGGCPYVSACSHRLGKRIRAAAALSGPAPLEAAEVAHGLGQLERLGLTYGRYVPWIFWRLLIWLVYRRRAADPAGAMQHGAKNRPPADAAQMDRAEVREACLVSETEAFRHGLRGLAWDARLLTRPWGFRLEEIAVPFFLWHGSDDRQAPLAMGKAVASRIPGCRAVFCQGEAHLLLFPHWKEILSALTST